MFNFFSTKVKLYVLLFSIFLFILINRDYWFFREYGLMLGIKGYYDLIPYVPFIIFWIFCYYPICSYGARCMEKHLEPAIILLNFFNIKFAKYNVKGVFYKCKFVFVYSFKLISKLIDDEIRLDKRAFLYSALEFFLFLLLDSFWCAFHVWYRFFIVYWMTHFFFHVGIGVYHDLLLLFL